MTEAEKYFMKWFPSAKVNDKYDTNSIQISPDSCIEFAQSYADQQNTKQIPNEIKRDAIWSIFYYAQFNDKEKFEEKSINIINEILKIRQ